MPPVTIAAIMPRATMATNVKLRVTLKRFCDVAKVGVAFSKTIPTGGFIRNPRITKRFLL